MALNKGLQFADEIDEYVVLKLVLSDYKGTDRPAPPEAEMALPNIRPKIRKDEKRLLRLYFRNWKAPYYGRLPGWREDSPVYMLWNGRLVGGLYVCDQNEFDSSKSWGQLHYFFIDPRFRGKGLHTLLFSEGVRRARSWGLEGVYINTDRYGLPEVYERWSAVFWRRIPKSIAYPKHSNMGTHNWLVYKIHDQVLAQKLRRYASGTLVDIGCGEKPYAIMTKGLVKEHIGVDHVYTQHDHTSVDICASAYDTTLSDALADTVLCTAVLEHLERPQDAIREMYRILKPGGYVILTAPLFWHLHEEPRDFYRYTKYGLQHLFTEAGFEVVELRPLSGFVVTFAQEFCYFLQRFRRRPISWVIGGIQFLIQWIAYRLNRWDRSHGFTWAYLTVGRKA